MSIRIGVLRPDRPSIALADAEARVIEHELRRRLDDVTVDLRVDGSRIGAWLPIEHASWPADVDHRLDAERLWANGMPPLVTLFGRTLVPDAAEVRHRMLDHLGLLSGTEFEPDRATDLWLVACADPEHALHDAVSTEPDGRLDDLFDELVAEWAHDLTPTVARLTAERDDARRAAAAAIDEQRRTAVELAERLDALRAEVDVLTERLERRHDTAQQPS